MLTKLKWFSIFLPFLLEGCVGIDMKTSPKEVFTLPVAYQDLYQRATLQAQNCWSANNECPIKGELNTASRTAQVSITGELGRSRYGQVDIRGLDDKSSEITVVVSDINIWNIASIAAMREALQFGVSTCSSYMPIAKPSTKR